MSNFSRWFQIAWKSVAAFVIVFYGRGLIFNSLVYMILPFVVAVFVGVVVGRSTARLQRVTEFDTTPVVQPTVSAHEPPAPPAPGYRG